MSLSVEEDGRASGKGVCRHSGSLQCQAKSGGGYQALERSSSAENLRSWGLWLQILKCYLVTRPRGTGLKVQDDEGESPLSVWLI